MGRGGGEGRVPRLMTAAVEREVSYSYFFSLAVHQGQPTMKLGLRLALVDALELLSAADWNILVFQPKCRNRVLESKH
jgi:hypothetical protein